MKSIHDADSLYPEDHQYKCVMIYYSIFITVYLYMLFFNISHIILHDHIDFSVLQGKVTLGEFMLQKLKLLQLKFISGSLVGLSRLKVDIRTNKISVCKSFIHKVSMYVLHLACYINSDLQWTTELTWLFVVCKYIIVVSKHCMKSVR